MTQKHLYVVVTSNIFFQFLYKVNTFSLYFGVTNSIVIFKGVRDQLMTFMGESYNKGTHCLKGGFETFPCYTFLIPHFAFEFNALLHAETECPCRL